MGKIIENGLNIKENGDYSICCPTTDGQEVTFRVVFPSLIQTVIKQKNLVSYFSQTGYKAVHFLL